VAAVKPSSKWGYIDNRGSIVVEPRLDNNALSFRAGMLKCNYGAGSWAIPTNRANTSGNLFVEIQFTSVALRKAAAYFVQWTIIG